MAKAAMTASTKDSAAAHSGARLMATALAAGTFAVLLIFLVFAVYNDVSQRNIRRDEVEKYLRTINSATAWGVDNWLADRVKLTKEVASHIAEAPPGADYVKLLDGGVYEQTFLWTYFGEANGAYHIWPADEDLPKDYDPRTRPWYKAAVASGKATLTEPYRDITTNVETITVAVPVYRDGKLFGVVGADFSTESLSKMLEESDLGDLGFAFLVTGDGRILAHPDRNLVSKTLAQAYPRTTPHTDDAVQYLNDAKTPQILRFSPIPSLSGVDWRLGLSINQHKAYASVREFRRTAAIATVAAALLLVVILGFVIHRMLVAPLMKARIDADAASAAKSEFLASMSHEIRTPMNGVLGMAEVLLNSNLDERQRDIASIIVSSGQALMTVINDILDFSKLEAGKLRLEPRGFNLRQMVHEVATMMQARALEKNIELIVRYAPNLPEGVVADESRLRQVLGNLIGNAVKFTDRGHVLIDVAGERAGDAVKLEFSISDTGIGIDPDEIPRMFEKFEQADGSHTRRFGGTGLGLAICKNIVELMGGEIGAESQPGEGSRFWFMISAPVDAKIKGMYEANQAIFDHVRLLAVDDNAVNRRVIEELMTGWGIEATVVASGEEALDALYNSAKQESPYDLLLMDFQMPEEDGVALTERIQADARFAEIPTIMLSSIDPSQSDAHDAKAKFVAHLPKPVRPSHLMDLMARVLFDRATRTLTHAARSLGAPKREKSRALEEQRAKVLIAEDNVVNQLVIRNLIDSDCFDVTIAENGRIAVDYFMENAPAIILMDLSMPVMDGIEATKRIRALEGERGLGRTPIIAATAHVLDADRCRCAEAGMDDFIAKPIRKAVLEEVLARWIRSEAPPAMAAAGRS